MADNNPNDFNSMGDVFKAYQDTLNFKDTIDKIYTGINNINKSFGDSRLRAVEFSNAISDSASSLVRVGASLDDIDTTIIAISEGARRNVIETTDTITEIYAAAQLIGQQADPARLVENFQAAGYEISQVGETVAESIGYVQSLGLNSRKIMQDVVNSMEYMNRFNFSDGVVGLTKMAAQASMLRFDMATTAKFADSVMNPQGAIEMASAFQRLGVMAGDLVDPFVLMDKSINDPAGLQDSLINLTKQFTMFDEKTQSFKIAPGAQRQIKEIAEAAGMTAAEFTKTALSAADMDRRLGQINLGINATEEEKMLVANMAKMGTGAFKGDYVVQIKDDEGKDQTKRLSDLQSEEFQKLREIQESAPKTVEEIQRSQLGVMETIQRDLAALPIQIGYAIGGQSAIIRGAEATKRIGDDIASALYSKGVLGSGEDSRKFFEAVGDDFQDLLVKASQGDTKALEGVTKRLDEKSSQLESGVYARFTEFVSQLGIEKPRDSIEQSYNNLTSGIVQKAKQSAAKEQSANQQKDVNINGQVRFVIDAPVGVDTARLTQYVQSPEFRNALVKVLGEIDENGTKPLPSRK
jgi:hypothetical protein